MGHLHVGTKLLMTAGKHAYKGQVVAIWREKVCVLDLDRGKFIVYTHEQINRALDAQGDHAALRVSVPEAYVAMA